MWRLLFDPLVQLFFCMSNKEYIHAHTKYLPNSNGIDLEIRLFNNSNAFLKISNSCVSLSPAAVYSELCKQNQMDRHIHTYLHAFLNLAAYLGTTVEFISWTITANICNPTIRCSADAWCFVLEIKIRNYIMCTWRNCAMSL